MNKEFRVLWNVKLMTPSSEMPQSERVLSQNCVCILCFPRVPSCPVHLISCSCSPPLPKQCQVDRLLQSSMPLTLKVAASSDNPVRLAVLPVAGYWSELTSVTLSSITVSGAQYLLRLHNPPPPPYTVHYLSSNTDGGTE